MIQIEVRYFATLRKDNVKKETISLKEDSLSGELLNVLEIPHEDVAIFLINGIKSGLDVVIKNGDIIALFPPVGGG